MSKLMTAAVSLCLAIAAGGVSAAQDMMKQDAMGKSDMKKDGMAKQDAMMKKDAKGKSAAKKGGMAKQDAMMNDGMKK